MLPEQILVMREIGDTSWPYWIPTSVDGVSLLLEPGENVLWSGQCRVEQLRPVQWSLPVTTMVVVTDRRTAFLTTDFDKGGGGWVGFGIMGAAVATTANVVTKHRAAKRAAGKIVAGQVRHEWVDEICVRRVKALIGGTGTYVDLSLPTVAGHAVIELWGVRVSDDPRFARWFASVVARHQLTLPLPRSTDEQSGLERYCADGYDVSLPGESDPLTWAFPGNVDELIGLATAHFSEQSNPAS
jgi:hypothetical protein